MPLLDLLASSDDPTRGASEQQGRPELLPYYGRHGLVLAREVAGHKDHRQVRGAFPEPVKDSRGALPQRPF